MIFLTHSNYKSLLRCPKNTKSIEYLTESKRQIGHNSAKPLIIRYHHKTQNDEILNSIYLVTGNSMKRNRNPIKQDTERYVKITK